MSLFLHQNMQIEYLLVLEKDGKFFQKIKKKNSCKICTKIPLVPIGQEFRPECNVSIFARKLVDSIFRGLGKKLENSIEMKNK